MDEWDVGETFMFLWIFFWSAVVFLIFVAAISIYTAIVETFLKIPNDKENDDEV